MNGSIIENNKEYPNIYKISINKNNNRIVERTLFMKTLVKKKKIITTIE